MRDSAAVKKELERPSTREESAVWGSVVGSVPTDLHCYKTLYHSNLVVHFDVFNLLHYWCNCFPLQKLLVAAAAAANYCVLRDSYKQAVYNRA